MPEKSSKKPTDSFHPVRDSHPYIFAGKREHTQSLTGFQKRVYEIVKKIPRGEVLTYKQVAKLAGRPRAWRAVGNVLNKNRGPKIPCHRVIRSDGKIGGYARGIKMKLSLLKKEGVTIKKTAKFLSAVLLFLHCF